MDVDGRLGPDRHKKRNATPPIDDKCRLRNIFSSSHYTMCVRREGLARWMRTGSSKETASDCAFEFLFRN